MDSFELNKIIGAILGTLLFVMGVGFLAEAVYEPRENGPGLSLPVPEGTAAAEGAAAEPAAPPPISVLLASADAAAGQNSAKKCQSCHNFAQGAGNKTGPELYGVVGRVMGSHEGFAYSSAMEEHKAAGDVWSYENLNHFLIAPKDFIPGTKMNFSGLKNDSERANVIAFLSTLSDNPVPFPEPEAAATEEPTAADQTNAPVEPAAEPVVAPETNANAVETPNTMPTDTPVEGTPISETEPSANTAVQPGPIDAAPAEPLAPATDGSSTMAPAAGTTTPAPAAGTTTTAPAAGTTTTGQ